MITWLQTFFLKHNKWLFGGLLVVIIVTFVLTIGPQSFFGSSRTQKRKELKYFGYDLSSEADQQAMVFEAQVSSYLHPELQIRRDQLMDYAYMRVAGLGIAKQLGIPEPTKEELSGFVSDLDVFQNPQTQKFSPEAYNGMINALQASGRYTRESIATVLREDYQIHQVRTALSGPDYFLPFEASRSYQDQETEYTITLANFNYDSFDPQIEATAEDLQQFFDENPSRYEIPETMSVTALQFKADSYRDEVPAPTDQDLQAYFDANKARYNQAADTQKKEGEGETPEVTLSDVRETVQVDWIKDQAKKIAAKKGEQFSVRLWQNTIAFGTDAFDGLVKEFKVTRTDIPPYSRGKPPQVPEAPPELLNSMWIYADNPSRYFSDISQTPDGAVVLAKREVTPSRMPDFDEIRDRVREDYNQMEKRRLFADKGKELRDTIRERLGTEAFTDIATSLGMEVEALEPFKGADVPNQLRAATLWDQTEYLDQGGISPMVLQPDKGVFAYVAKKIIPEVDTGSDEFKEYLAQRSGATSDNLGWARLREITDKSLSTIFKTTDNQ